MTNCTISDPQVIAFDVLATSPSGRISGWVSQPSYRGTWDIMWTSLVTIFICTYTLLCLNVPAPRDTRFVMFRRRIMWMFLAILGPEVVLTYAAGQWSRARHSVDAFHASGFTQWTMRQAFFTDMGGFVLHAHGSAPFPLNAKQLHWLVVNEHVPYPEVQVRQEEIWDKSKQDRLARVIALCQMAYSILQCVGRAAQGLAITTLELNTLGIVVCSLFTAFAWLHKPADIHTPFRITTSATIDEITGGRVWKVTPLDFVDENGPGWAMNVQSFAKMPTIPPERPIQRIPNDRFPMTPYSVQEYCLCFATLVFGGIHVAGWNFSFPSETEKLLWRGASLLLFGVTAAFWLLETMASWKRLGRWTWLYLRVTNPRALPEFEKAREERLSRLEDAEPTTLPLPWEFWTIMPVAALYGVSRLYLVTEAFLELRDIDGTVFVNVDWSAYFPHV
ncbi:hypothetical protein QBC33DRAFT_530425 [Phialemonium atrogriseum]|uniref:Uncharacterized protein n=1 Tax=Phialemonium atrogriseum TaxID=1093897 RepID=A0AAJ0C7M3_9PEZI|nr:uncharacterized protein QBC33DRAFT_530425 [Phialemonium atrogriseum]KAK1770212.1 hypothetical protein QBC33DRAFT_530425 [Phialemonium atrogriseum]